jgi:hypothetical protein
MNKWFGGVFLFLCGDVYGAVCSFDKGVWSLWMFAVKNHAKKMMKWREQNSFQSDRLLTFSISPFF